MKLVIMLENLRELGFDVFESKCGNIVCCYFAEYEYSFWCTFEYLEEYYSQAMVWLNRNGFGCIDI